MTVFVVAGCPDCYLFNHARYIATFLSKHLPNFKMHIIEIDSSNWKTWIKEMNLKYSWYHFNSPVIWKELVMRGGKPHYIGGVSEFWEYCYDYYGLVSILDQEDLDNLTKDAMQFYSVKEEVHKEILNKKFIIICISGDQDNLINLLVMNLLGMDNIFAGRNELTIRIYNHNNDESEDIDIAIMNEWSSNFDFKVEKVDDINIGISNCDLFILTGDFTRETDEDFFKWLNRNYLSMINLSDAINNCANPNLRVMVAVHGPVCFNAAVLIEHITTIKLHNIVALTADVGLDILNEVRTETASMIMDFGAPPVWGFIGVNKIIDLEHIIEIFDVYRPNLRAVKNTYGSTLELGKTRTDLRYLNYFAHEFKNVWLSIYQRKGSLPNGFINYYSKVRGIISLIKNWYSATSIGNIISLGIISNGTFDIPAGLVFSQPVQYKDKRWQPVSMFPTPRKDPADIQDLVPFIRNIYNFFNLREHIDPELI